MDTDSRSLKPLIGRGPGRRLPSRVGVPEPP